MEKILLAIDSQNINYSVIEFAYYIAKLTGSKLTGLFIESPAYEHKYVHGDVHSFADHEKETISAMAENARINTEQGILFFKEACAKEQVRYEVFRNQGAPIENIVYESRFADLLIIDAGIAAEDNEEKALFAKEVLMKAECPVIIPPVSFNTIEEVIFCYDGSRSAVFAMKQFTYLFPQYIDKKVVVLEVNEEGVTTIYEKEKIRGLLKGHYSQIGFVVLNGDPTIELFTYLLQKKNSFVVMGAFGRRMISNILTGSRADLDLRINDLPLFITHT
jgi:hypothetical protein